MSLLKNLKTDASIQGETDRIGGGGAVPSAIYAMEITMAYLTVSDEKTDATTGVTTGGALALNVSFKTDDGKSLNETYYVTGGADKGKKNTYLDKDKNEQYLPGYLMANALSELTVGLPLNELDTEDKVVEIYDFAAKAKVPKKVPVVTQLLKQKIYGGVLRVVTNKQVKQQGGGYITTNDKRTFNELNKVFCARDGKFNKMTKAEIEARKVKDDVTAAFYPEWEKAFSGKDKDNFKEVAGAPAGTSGGTQTSSGAVAAKTSLFGND